MAERPDAVIFDLDGVLVDSEVLSSETLIAELAQDGIVVTPERVRREFLGRSFPAVAEGLRRSASGALPDDFEARYRARLLAAFETRLRLTAGIDAVLSRLAVPARVATSSTPIRARRTLEIAGPLGTVRRPARHRLGGRPGQARARPLPAVGVARRPAARPLPGDRGQRAGILAAARGGHPVDPLPRRRAPPRRGWDGPAPSVGSLNPGRRWRT